jgi:hypothetical protein
MSIKDEAVNAAVRVAFGQAVKGVKSLLDKFATSKRSKKVFGSKTTTGALTTAVGFAAAAVTDNPIVQGISQEARVLGMTSAASGLVDSALGRDEEEDKKKS